MDNIKISIIIPVYNVEQWLPECLDSCINQTLKEIEIICVNDCSPDNSGKILERYAARDNRVRIITHVVNKGLGAARNTGLAASHGEYIWFVDSDDYIALDACQFLYDTAKKNDVDILCFNMSNFIMSTDKEERKLHSIDRFTWINNSVIHPDRDALVLQGNMLISACIYIARRRYVSKFSFRENCFYEDTDYVPILFTCAESVLCIEYIAYYRRLRADSIMHTSLSQKKIEDKKAVVISLKKFIEIHKIPKEHFLYKFFSGFASYVAGLIYKNDILYELGIHENDKIVIYGAGSWGKNIYELLTSYNIEIPFFVDSSLEKQQTYVCDLPVKGLNALANYNGIVFIAVKKDCSGIAKMLESMGNLKLRIILLDDYIKLLEIKKQALLRSAE